MNALRIALVCAGTLAFAGATPAFAQETEHADDVHHEAEAHEDHADEHADEHVDEEHHEEEGAHHSE